MSQHNHTDRNLLGNYSRIPISFVRGDGAYLVDDKSRIYLDFLCGIAVTSFGHNHPAIRAAVDEQLASFWHVSNLFDSPQQNGLATALSNRSGLDKVFFCNSGTEANEAAIKFCRKYNGQRSTIITCTNSFHGRTYGSMSASGQPKIHEGFSPLCPGFKSVAFDDCAALESAIDPTVGAIMVEPILGEAGVVVPHQDYLRNVRHICDDHNLLLLVDEIQTGIGRTGKLFAYQWSDIRPDIVTCAKALANGLPLGAVLCSAKVGDAITAGCHGSTFGGNPIAVAAAHAVLDCIDDGLLAHIDEMGTWLRKSITEIASPCIKEIRGRGFMIGVEFTPSIDAKQVQKLLYDRSKPVLVGTSGSHTIRILPPFIARHAECAQFMEIFTDVVHHLG